nr:leucine-rich repeat-containing protein 40-like [Anolis sagrei ordinatus]
MKLGNSTPFPLLSIDLQWKYLLEHDPQNEGVKKLKLEGKELMSVPRQLFALEELQVLEMSPERKSCLRYALDFIPHEIGHLRNLTLLHLDSNNLKDIPVEIGLLIKLERLTLSNNNLTFLPKEIGGLQRLRSLHLANNNLTEFPESLCQLRNLVFLDATDNQMSTIPDDIHQLQKLETLLLLFNSVKHLPRGICSLKSLTTLWLGHNKLKELPSSFGQLIHLDWGRNYCSCNFEGNPLKQPPLDICSGGPAEIREYFASLKEQREV